MDDNSKDNEILKINQLIKEKYSQKKKDNEDNQVTKKFIGIKKSANQLNFSHTNLMIQEYMHLMLLLLEVDQLG